MDSPNLGSDWFWVALGVCAAIGAVAIIVGMVYGAYWLVDHVTLTIN